jgi:hypothetical protein
MAWLRRTTAISRTDLALESLKELRTWPGCERVASVGVLSVPPDRFILRVIEYGSADKKLADRALRFIEREKLRRYHLNTDYSR